MANYNTYNFTGGGDKLKDAVPALANDITRAKTQNADTADPTSPADHERWTRTDTPEEPQDFIELPTGGKTRLLGIYKLFANLNHNLKQAVNFVLEKLGAPPAASSANEGRKFYDTAQKRAGYCTDADEFYDARAKADGTSFVRIACDMNVATLGSPATEEDLTLLDGWTLDAAAEELNLVAQKRIPAEFTGAHALTLEILALLRNNETADDDIDAAGEFRSVRPGQGPGKAATALAAVTKDIGSDNAQYALHVIELAVPYNDGTNPIASGDLVVATINHNAAGQVGGIIVVGASLLVPVYGFIEKA